MTVPRVARGRTSAARSASLGTWTWHMILSWITLAAVQAAFYIRLSRGQLLDMLGEDYIRTARAKGLSERRVVFKHGVRAVLTPVAAAFVVVANIIVDLVYALLDPRVRIARSR